MVRASHYGLRLLRPAQVRIPLETWRKERLLSENVMPKIGKKVVALKSPSNSGRSYYPGGSSFPIIKGSWAKWALWGSPSSRDRDPDPRMTRDLEGTLVRFSPSRRIRGSWLTLARILPRASSAVETADLRHWTRTPHSASGRPCPKTRIHRQRTVILGALACGTTIMETRMPDLGSTEAQGRWHGDGRI